MHRGVVSLVGMAAEVGKWRELVTEESGSSGRKSDKNDSKLREAELWKRTLHLPPVTGSSEQQVTRGSMYLTSTETGGGRRGLAASRPSQQQRRGS